MLVAQPEFERRVRGSWGLDDEKQEVMAFRRDPSLYYWRQCTLWNVAAGLAALDLPVLLVLAIADVAERLADTDSVLTSVSVTLSSAAHRWALGQAVKAAAHRAETRRAQSPPKRQHTRNSS